MLSSSWARERIPVIGIGTLGHGVAGPRFSRQILTPRFSENIATGSVALTGASTHVSRSRRLYALRITDYRPFSQSKVRSELPKVLEIENVVVVSEVLQ